MKDKGLLVILSGPSGAGKDTVIDNLLKKDENIKISTSVTTRTPRKGEIDGVDYHFVSDEEFKKIVSQDGMLEYAMYCDNYYGTPKDPIETWICEGKDVVLEIETDGGFQVMDRCKDAISIFIIPPSIRELESRLFNRATDEKKIIKKRLDIAKREIRCAENYDYIVVNNTVDQCADDIYRIIVSEKMKSRRRANIIKEVLDDE